MTMEEMNYFGFENGDEYEIADKKAREGVDKLNSNLVNNAGNNQFGIRKPDYGGQDAVFGYGAIDYKGDIYTC